MDLCRESGIVAQDINHHGHIHVTRFENRLAIVERFQLGKFLDILFDQIGESPDQSSALAGRELAPGPAAVFKRSSRRLDCAVHIRGRSLGNLREHCARRRIHRVKRLRTFGPLAIDQ